MKKWIILFAVLAVLAGAACAYWFGWTWYQGRGLRLAAEQFEAEHALVDVVCLLPVGGKQFAITVDPVRRTAEIDRKTDTPYIMVVLDLVEKAEDNEEIVDLFNDTLGLAQDVAGRHTKVMLVIVGENADGSYSALWGYSFHTGETITEQDLFGGSPLYGISLPQDLVRFPGREG